MNPGTLIFLLFSLLLFPAGVSAQKFDAEIIEYSTMCVAGTDKLTQTEFVTIQINNRQGDKYTEIAIPYSKEEKVTEINAWIEKMDGTKVRDFKKSDIIDKSAISDISLYEDNYNKCFQLKHNFYPYKVIYTYKTTYRNFLTIARWTPVIYAAIPTRSARLQVIVPKNFPYNRFGNNVEDPDIDSTDALVMLEWKATYNKPVKPEIFSQPGDSQPYVIVAPLNFRYGAEGSTKNWESYGNWLYRLMEGLDVLPEDEKNTIRALIRDITDKKEIVKMLYHYMQDHTRYINVSIGIGGMKPYPASYVAQNKYGDCKALTNYMKALLGFAGIESCYTLVDASEQPHTLIKSFSGPQFNHVILAVPLGNDTIWLENTDKNNPFGYMGTFTQNREALLVSKDHSKLVRIPALKIKDDLVYSKMEFELNINGDAGVKMNTTFRGNDFEAFSQLHSDFNDDEKDRIIRNYMPFDNYEVLNWELIKTDRDSAYIELDATISLNKFLKPLGNEYYFSLSQSRIPDFSVAANRTLPVVLPYPLSNSDTLIFGIPQGYELKTRPDTISISAPYGNYRQEMKVSNGNIQVVKYFELFHGSYAPEQYPEFYAFIKSVKDLSKRKIIIKPVN